MVRENLLHPNNDGGTAVSGQEFGIGWVSVHFPAELLPAEEGTAKPVNLLVPRFAHL